MIRRGFYTFGVILSLSASTPALADPTGTYNVAGINPDDGGEYHGTVTVKRTGETYSVTWTIAGTEANGVGIGGKRGNTETTGVASVDDDMITIGYGNESGFGISQYDLQPDGSWKGRWAYADGEKVSTETWTRPGAARSLERPKTPTSEAMKPMSSPAARP
ncbi:MULTISPECIES: hypothetical protein [unclassified Rhizobium]|uniref:hypothetical protein n=1 Tax=unclassified Rhizobium TaxID=2613769 RepID=UPI000AD5119A|nr:MULTISPECIES: hypothetical protein [unclassified Rhizobium]